MMKMIYLDHNLNVKKVKQIFNQALKAQKTQIWMK